MQSIKFKMAGLIKEKDDALTRAIEMETERQALEDRAREVYRNCPYSTHP